MHTTQRLTIVAVASVSILAIAAGSYWVYRTTRPTVSWSGEKAFGNIFSASSLAEVTARSGGVLDASGAGSGLAASSGAVTVSSGDAYGKPDVMIAPIGITTYTLPENWELPTEVASARTLPVYELLGLSAPTAAVAGIVGQEQAGLLSKLTKSTVQGLSIDSAEGTMMFNGSTFSYVPRMSSASREAMAALSVSNVDTPQTPQLANAISIAEEKLRNLGVSRNGFGSGVITTLKGDLNMSVAFPVKINGSPLVQWSGQPEGLVVSLLPTGELVSISGYNQLASWERDAQPSKSLTASQYPVVGKDKISEYITKTYASYPSDTVVSETLSLSGNPDLVYQLMPSLSMDTQYREYLAPALRFSTNEAGKYVVVSLLEDYYAMIDGSGSQGGSGQIEPAMGTVDLTAQ